MLYGPATPSQLETGTQKCWLLSNQAHSNSNYKPNKRPPAGIADWDWGMGNGDSGTVGQMKSEPNGNAKTVPKHKFAAFIGKREGSRLHSALKSFEFIVRSAVGPLCGLPQPVAVSAVCPSCLLPVCLAVRPAFLSFSQFTNLLLTAANCVKLPTIVASFNLCNTVRVCVCVSALCVAQCACCVQLY